MLSFDLSNLTGGDGSLISRDFLEILARLVNGIRTLFEMFTEMLTGA